MYLQRHKGIALVAAVMLMVFATIAVFGVVTFITQRLRQQPTEEAFLKAIYLAHAGLNYSMYQYRSAGALYSGTISNIDGNGGYAVVATAFGGGGGQADLLRVDATGSYWANNNKDLDGITLTNTSSSSSITITYMIMFLASGSETLNAVRINGSNVWTDNTSIGTSPVTLDITNVTIPANTTRNINRIRFTNSASDKTIYVQFTMSDSTTTSICTVYPTPASACGSSSLTIRSMGRPAGSSVYRTLNTEYNTVSGTITSCTETNATVP